VAALRFSLPLQVYANFSVCGLNSIPVDPVGLVRGQTVRSVESVGSGFLRRASWVLSAALGGFQIQLSTTTVFKGSNGQYGSFHV